MDFKASINTNKLPRHIAIIMDGNGRWAKQKGLDRIIGHENGVKPVRAIAEAGAELGIEFITLYAFSTENWKRPVDEVNALMSLLVDTINKETKTLNENNIRLSAIGNLDILPEKSHMELLEAIKITEKNTRMTLILALSYSSKWEITNAAKKLAEQVKNGTISPEDINEQMFSDYLTTKEIPDPELLIRTSGEYRISNFLLWQIAYTELYFTEVLWPDFSKDDFYKAIISYQNRERRFGLTSDQLK